MIPTTPIEIEGETYDRYTASLAMMIRHTKGGGQKVSANVRLVPTRIDSETGDVITRDDHAQNLTNGDTLTGSTDVINAVDAILAAGQAFINGRGL